MTTTLAGCAAGRLAGRADLALVMGAEPDAVLLEEALAFYVPRSYEAFDGGAFLAALKSAGGGWCGVCVWGGGVGCGEGT